MLKVFATVCPLIGIAAFVFQSMTVDSSQKAKPLPKTVLSSQKEKHIAPFSLEQKKAARGRQPF
jgi:hypothetical protein